MAEKGAAPIIIKRKKVIVGGGHHGGAWKVAYADFVTAMMAFFLLMWLLNATTEKQRKGLADYFNPTIAVNRISGGGEAALNGDSIMSQDELAQSGKGATSQIPSPDSPTGGLQQAQDALSRKHEDSEFASLKEMLDGSGGESMVTENLARHILTKVTDEGLIVELFDLEREPLFVQGALQPTELSLLLAEVIARVFRLVDNRVAVRGHIRTQPEVLRVNRSWELSTGRAQAMRLLLEHSGLAAERFQRQEGRADRSPADPNPMALRNNRLEVILLRSDLG